MTDETFTEAPHSLASEMAVLGACMFNPNAVDESKLTPGAFYRPAHQTIFAAMRRLVEKGQPTDPAAVVVELGADLTRVGAGPYLHTLYQAAAVGGVAYHAKVVHAKHRLRLIIEEAHRTVQRAQTAHAADDDPEELIDDVSQVWANLRNADEDDELETLLTLDDFVGRQVEHPPWVLGDLVAAGERVVVTGYEGLGKSTLLRQFAIAAAAGLHPFTLATCDPVRVLVLDMENPEHLMIQAWQRLREATRRRGRPVVDGRLMIDRRPAGIDLAQTSDRRWLCRRVEMYRPELLVIGPAYKLYVGGDNSREETLARMVMEQLDQLRASTGCALLIEHHSPHGESGKRRSVRPYGSTLWQRWPEFGWGIYPTDEPQTFTRRSVEVSHWKGGRAERPWPERLESGPDGWPWTEAPPAERWAS